MCEWLVFEGILGFSELQSRPSFKVIILENIPNGILPYVLEPLVSSPALKELSKHPCMWKKLIESEVPLSAYQALPTAVERWKP